MKKNLRLFSRHLVMLMTILLFGCLGVQAQTYYRSNGAVTTNAATNWQTSSDSSAWSAAATAPSGSENITIAGSNTFTVPAATTFTVTGRLTYASSGAKTITGNLVFDANSFYVVNNANANAAAPATNTTWNASSTILVVSFSTSASLLGGNGPFGNVNVISNQTLIFSTSATPQITIAGNLNVAGGSTCLVSALTGTIVASSTTHLTISGNVSVNNSSQFNIYNSVNGNPNALISGNVDVASGAKLAMNNSGARGVNLTISGNTTVRGIFSAGGTPNGSTFNGNPQNKVWRIRFGGNVDFTSGGVFGGYYANGTAGTAPMGSVAVIFSGNNTSSFSFSDSTFPFTATANTNTPKLGGVGYVANFIVESGKTINWNNNKEFYNSTGANGFMIESGGTLNNNATIRIHGSTQANSTILPGATLNNLTNGVIAFGTTGGTGVFNSVAATASNPSTSITASAVNTQTLSVSASTGILPGMRVSSNMAGLLPANTFVIRTASGTSINLSESPLLTVKTYANALAIAIGDYVISGSNLYQATSTATTNSPTGPSGTSTTTAGGVNFNYIGNTLPTITVTGVAGTQTVTTTNATTQSLPSGVTWAGSVQYTATTGGQTIAAGSYVGLSMSNTSGTNTAAGNITVTTGTFTTTAGGTLNMGTNTLTLNASSTVTNNGTIRSQATASALSNNKVYGGKVILDGGAAQALTVSTSTQFNKLTIDNAFGVTITNQLTVNDTLEVTSGSTLNLQANSLVAGASFRNIGSGTIQTQTTSTTGIPASQTWASKLAFNNSTAAQTQTIPIGTYASLDLSGGTTGGRSFTASGTYTITGDFTIPTGSGAITNSGTTFIFSGSSAQTINGAFTFPNLTINKTGTADALTLGGATTVSGTLTLTSGRVATTATNTLTVSTNTVGALSYAGGYIDGPFTRAVATGASNSYVFPVGKYVSATDNILSARVANVGTAGNVTVTPFTGDAGGNAGASLSTLSTSEYWSILHSAGATGTVSFYKSPIGSFAVIGNSSTQVGTYASIGGNISGDSIVGGTVTFPNNTASFFVLAVPPLIDPAVTIGSASSVTTTSATIAASVTTLGYPAYSSKGFYYGTSAAPSGNNTTVSGTALGAYSANISGLTPNTVYYFRGYATNSTPATGTSGDGTLTTVSNPATVGNETSVTSTSFTANWTAPASQGAAAYTYTLQIATDNLFTQDLTTVTNLSTTSYSLTGLQALTTYYYRVYVVNAGGTSAASSTQTVNTIGGTPAVSTPTRGTVTTTTAVLGATVVNDGGGTITARGVVYGLTDNPTTNFTAEGGTSTGAFTQTVTGLSSNTTYYFRGAATTDGGSTYGYSASSSFTTPAATPVVGNETSVNATGFTANWSAVSGNASVTYELQYSSDISFPYGFKTYSYTGLSGTSQVVTQLASATNYYYRVRATNSVGTTAWSSIQTVTTSTGTALLLNTLSETPEVALSVRKINKLYGGPAVRARRGSDGELRDVYFDNSGEVSLSSVVSAAGGGAPTATTLSTWVGTGYNANAFVTIWYDQSGNDNHASNALINRGTIATSTSSATVTGTNTNFVNSVTISARTTAGSKYVDNFTYTGTLEPGMRVTGTGIPDSTYLIVNTSNRLVTTSFYLSKNATASTTGVTLTLTHVGNTLYTSGGLPLGTIASVESPTSLTLNSNAAATLNDKPYSTALAGAFLIKTGTISVTSGNTSVAGTATTFASGNRDSIAPNSVLVDTLGRFIGIVSSVTNGTSLTLSSGAINTYNGRFGVAAQPLLVTAGAMETFGTSGKPTVRSLQANVGGSTLSLPSHLQGVTNFNLFMPLQQTRPNVNASGNGTAYGFVFGSYPTFTPSFPDTTGEFSAGFTDTDRRMLMFNSKSTPLTGLAQGQPYGFRFQILTNGTYPTGMARISTTSGLASSDTTDVLTTPFINVPLNLYSNTYTGGSQSRSFEGKNPEVIYFAGTSALNESNATAVANSQATYFSLPDGPSITTASKTSIDSVSAVLGANVTSAGDGTISARGTLFGTSSVPTTNQLAEGGTSTGAYSHARTGLTANTKYYYRGYVTTQYGTQYTTVDSFATRPLAPTVADESSVSTTGFTANWTAPTQGSVAFTYSIQLATDAGFTLNVSTINNIASGNTSYVYTGLTPETNYYYRVRTSNETGVSNWSASQLVTTSGRPSISLPTVSSITVNSAVLGATITSQGGSVITARGTVWGTVNPPTTNALAEGTTGASAISTFTHTRSGFVGNTLYYYRGYATNSAGVRYTTSVGSFITLPNQVTAIAANSQSVIGFTARWNAHVGGNQAVTYKLQYSTSNTFASNNVTISGLTATSQAIVGLAAGGTYYYRVAATNSTGDGAWSATITVTTTSATYVLNRLNTMPTLAYSTRRLNAAYAGPALRAIKNASTSDSVEVYFDNTGLISLSSPIARNGQRYQDSTLGQWVTGTDSAFVNRWFDQSGNGRDAFQTTRANYPRVVSNGAVDTSASGIPALRFMNAATGGRGFTVTSFTNDGAGTNLQNMNNLNLFVAASKVVDATLGMQHIFGTSAPTGNSRGLVQFHYRTSTSTTTQLQIYSAVASPVATLSSLNHTAPYAFCLTINKQSAADSGTSNIRTSGGTNAQTIGTTVIGNSALTNTAIQIYRHSSNTGRNFEGASSEMIFYGTTSFTRMNSADSVLLIANQDSLYAKFQTANNGNWVSASTWKAGRVPASTDSVLVNHTVTLTGTTSIAGLATGSTGIVSMNGNDLTIGRAAGYTTGGGIRGATSGTLTVSNGTLFMDQSLPIVSGVVSGRSNFVNNLTISGGNTVTLGNTLHVTGVLTKTTGTLATNGFLTLKSTASGSASIPLVTSGSFTGNVVVERFIPRGKRAFRDVAPGVSGAGSVFANWQEGGAFTAGYGAYITGIAASKTFLEAKAATGFVDATTGLDLSASGSKSMFTYDNSLSSGNWSSGVTNTKLVTLSATSGYRLLVRGDRNWSMYLLPQADSMINATTLRTTGTLLTGTQSITGLNTTANGFSLVGNPYVSVIDWLALSKSNLNTTMWILSPRTRGYVTVNGSGVVVPSAGGHNIDRYIQPGQAFFVQTTANGAASLSITESHKASAANIKSVFDASENNANNILRIGLYKPLASVTTSMVDEAAVLFGNYSNAVNGDDSYKLENSADNIALLNSGNKLAIEARSAASANDVLPLGFSKLSNGTNYQLKVDASGYNSNGFDVYVKDAYKQTETAVKVGSETVVDFTIDNAVSASYNNRFTVVFKPSVLPISSINLEGSQQGNDVVLNINTIGESNINNYVVEKSTDGVAYSKIATVTAKNTATASYSVTDSKAVSGNNYYRVQVNGLNEASTYSKVVVVKVGGNAAKYALYPNPSKGSEVGIQLTGVSAGKYTVTLRNMLGQEVHRAVLAHAGGNGQLSIRIASKLASGSYTVSVLGATATPMYQGKLVVE